MLRATPCIACDPAPPSILQPPKRRSSITPTPHNHRNASTAATGSDCCTNCPVAASSSGGVSAGSHPASGAVAGARSKRMKVAAGTSTMAINTPIATVWRVAALRCDSAPSAMAATTASNVPCHNECSSAVANTGAICQGSSATTSISASASPSLARSASTIWSSSSMLAVSSSSARWTSVIADPENARRTRSLTNERCTTGSASHRQVGVAALGIVALHQSLVGHDGQHLQDRRVGRVLGLGQFGVYLANGHRRLARPEHAQDRQFAFSGVGGGHRSVRTAGVRRS